MLTYATTIKNVIGKQPENTIRTRIQLNIENDDVIKQIIGCNKSFIDIKRDSRLYEFIKYVNTDLTKNYHIKKRTSELTEEALDLLINDINKFKQSEITKLISDTEKAKKTEEKISKKIKKGRSKTT